MFLCTLTKLDRYGTTTTRTARHIDRPKPSALIQLCSTAVCFPHPLRDVGQYIWTTRDLFGLEEQSAACQVCLEGNIVITISYHDLLPHFFLTFASAHDF